MSLWPRFPREGYILAAGVLCWPFSLPLSTYQTYIADFTIQTNTLSRYCLYAIIEQASIPMERYCVHMGKTKQSEYKDKSPSPVLKSVCNLDPNTDLQHCFSTWSHEASSDNCRTIIVIFFFLCCRRNYINGQCSAIEDLCKLLHFSPSIVFTIIQSDTIAHFVIISCHWYGAFTISKWTCVLETLYSSHGTTDMMINEANPMRNVAVLIPAANNWFPV